MASLKEVKTRINSVKNTRKITSAMKMVASAKLHKAQTAIEHMLPYQRALNRILTNFLGSDVSVQSPYLDKREVKRLVIVVFSSHTSLCGAFNSNVIKKLLQTLDEQAALGVPNVTLLPVGKKVYEAIQRLPQPYVCDDRFASLSDKPTYSEAARLASHLLELFRNGETDRVELIYHHFHSAGVQQLRQETYLPLDLDELTARCRNEQAADGVFNDYIVEPTPSAFIESLLPTVLSQQLFTVAVDSNASEHAARMFAMQTATDNANELIQDLTQQYNKSRQQAITNELLDIVGGSFQ